MKLVVPEWFSENKAKLSLLVGLVLVGVLSFEAGLLLGKTGQGAPIVLTIPATSIPLLETAQNESTALPSAEKPIGTPAETLGSVEPVAARVGAGATQTNCTFVGSKNSNKYHLASCAVAKRIKPENRVCFASEEEAKRRGYVPSCLK